MGLINVKWKGASLKQDASNRLVTDKEKTTWNNKANGEHTHAKSDIKDFPSSLPASDVYSWAKASSKPSYSKSEVGLGNVDNTADSTKSVKYATSAGNANALNWVAGNEIKFTKPNYTTEQDLHFCWSWADNSKVKLIKQYIFDGGDGNPTQVKASQFNGPLNGNASSASSVPWSGVTGKPSTFPPSSHSHSYVPLSGGTMTGTLSLKNTGLQIISNLPEDFSGTPRGDRQVLWYSKEFEDDSYKYEDYCEHYINLGTPNSGAGNGKFGATVQVRFYKENANCHTDVRINDGVTSNISVVLPVKSGTLQVSSSDVKLKTNITDTEVDDAISFINKIHLHSFDWKTDDTHQSIGFIADELEELDERLSVGGNSDKVDENGLPIDPKCVNTFYLQGYEVKAIQELSSKVDALEKENEELKSRLTKLENK